MYLLKAGKGGHGAMGRWGSHELEAIEGLLTPKPVTKTVISLPSSWREGSSSFEPIAR